MSFGRKQVFSYRTPSAPTWMQERLQASSLGIDSRTNVVFCRTASSKYFARCQKTPLQCHWQDVAAPLRLAGCLLSPSQALELGIDCIVACTHPSHRICRHVKAVCGWSIIKQFPELRWLV